MLWKNPTRIQRLSPPNGRRPCFGGSDKQVGALTSAFHFEYMGAAEYEWQQVPSALRRISENLPDFLTGDFQEFGRKRIYFLVHKDCRDGLFSWIRNHLVFGDHPGNREISPMDPTFMDKATDSVYPDSNVTTIAWLALGGCPWFATTEREKIDLFTNIVSEHFAHAKVPMNS